MSETLNLDFRDPLLELQALVAPYHGMYLLDTVRRLIIPLKPTPDYAQRLGGGVQTWERSALLDQLVDDRDLSAMRAALSPEAVSESFAQLCERRVLQYRQADSGWVKIVLQPCTIENGKTTLALVTYVRTAAPLANRSQEDPATVRLRVNLTTDQLCFIVLRGGADNGGAGRWHVDGILPALCAGRPPRGSKHRRHAYASEHPARPPGRR